MAHAHSITEDALITGPEILVSIRPSHLTIYESFPGRSRSAKQEKAAALLQNADQVAAFEIGKLLRNEYSTTAQIIEATKTAITYSGLVQEYTKLTGRSLIEDLEKDHRIPSDYIQKMLEEVETDISRKAASRIKKAVNWLVEMAESKTLRWICKETGRPKKGTFKVNFVTLTLSASQSVPAEQYDQLPATAKKWFTFSEVSTRKTWISDNDIKSQLLNHFLTECRQYVAKESGGADKLVYYFWRAEAQKNGNIHFHILTDKYLPWEVMREIWNRIQNKMGFVDRYADAQREKHKNGFVPDLRAADRWPVAKQIEAYKKGIACNWSNPNSTDVHSIKGINNLAAYLAKYVSKGDNETRIITGRKWYLSTALSKLNSATAYIEDVIEDVRKLKRKHREKYLDHCSQIYANVSDLIKLDCEQILTAFRRYKTAMKAAAYGIDPPSLIFN